MVKFHNKKLILGKSEQDLTYVHESIAKLQLDCCEAAVRLLQDYLFHEFFETAARLLENCLPT